MVKYWTKNISGNIEAAFLKLAPQMCITRRNKMTPLVFAIATLSAPVSLCHKKQMSPFAAFKVRQRVLLGTNIVLILS